MVRHFFEDALHQITIFILFPKAPYRVSDALKLNHMTPEISKLFQYKFCIFRLFNMCFTVSVLTKKNDTSFPFKLCFIVQSEQKLICLLLTTRKEKHIGNSYYKEGNDKDTPEAHNDSYDSTKECLRVYVSKTHTAHGDDHVPHAVMYIAKILTSHVVKG